MLSCGSISKIELTETQMIVPNLWARRLLITDVSGEVVEISLHGATRKRLTLDVETKSDALRQLCGEEIK